jgi:hypothetical protein
LDFLERGDLIPNVMMQSNSGREENFAGLMTSAEREPGAFVKAVADSFGTEQAGHAAEDWLEGVAVAVAR